MAQLIQNDITFDNYKNRGGQQIGNYPIRILGSEGPDEDGVGIINAVDIDWNGAVLPNGDITTGGSKTIATTGELMKMINEMQKEIYTLTAAVITLARPE